jgi:hypothetical protein
MYGHERRMRDALERIVRTADTQDYLKREHPEIYKQAQIALGERAP